MLDIHVYAAILLSIRVVSMSLILFVLKKQWELFRLPIEKKAIGFRKTLFLSALVIFLGNIIPAIIDILTIHGSIVGRPSEVNTISVIYSFDNALVALLSSLFMWLIYYRQVK